MHDYSEVLLPPDTRVMVVKEKKWSGNLWEVELQELGETKFM